MVERCRGILLSLEAVITKQKVFWGELYYGILKVNGMSYLPPIHSYISETEKYTASSSSPSNKRERNRSKKQCCVKQCFYKQ